MAGSGEEAEERFGFLTFGKDGFGQGSGVGVEELEGEALDDDFQIGGGNEVAPISRIVAS